MAEQRRITICGRPVGPQKAAVGQTGQQLSRNTPKKSYRLPEARRAAEAAEQSLMQDFGDVEWIAQARDGLEVYLQRCIEQFSATPAPRNAPPITQGSDYRQFARSAEEIKETMAAEEGSVTRARNVPRYRQRPDEVEIPEAEIADPMRVTRTPPVPGDGWAL